MSTGGEAGGIGGGGGGDGGGGFGEAEGGGDGGEGAGSQVTLFSIIVTDVCANPRPLSEPLAPKVMAVAHKMMPSTCASAKIVATPGLMSTSNPSTKSPPPHECDGSLVHACPGATPSCRAASGYDPPRVPAIRTM